MNTTCSRDILHDRRKAKEDRLRAIAAQWQDPQSGVTDLWGRAVLATAQQLGADRWSDATAARHLELPRMTVERTRRRLLEAHAWPFPFATTPPPDPCGYRNREPEPEPDPDDEAETQTQTLRQAEVWVCVQERLDAVLTERFLGVIFDLRDDESPPWAYRRRPRPSPESDPDESEQRAMYVRRLVRKFKQIVSGTSDETTSTRKRGA
jgi:hypothetical protein